MADSSLEGNSETAVLAAFASRLRFESIPQKTIEHTKLSILDTIGCALFGATLPWIERLQTFVLREGGHAQATLWGSTVRVSRTQAALVNATATHSFEFDDVHMGGMIHPGALALGAVLAVGEPASIGGADLLTAVVAGCEVGARVGRSVGTAHFRAGFHPQGTVGVFAAGAAAGRALGLDAECMRDTLGLSGSQASGLMAAQEGSMAKRLHSGLACQSGVRSALLASDGFTGIPDVFEAPFGGFCSTMGGGDVHLDELTAGLGARWETNEIGFKPYASCAAAQSSIGVARELRDTLVASGDEVRTITVHCSTHAKVHCGWEYHPTGVTASQMSIPYGVASMLVHGDVSAERFTQVAISDPVTLEMAKRVTVVGDDAIDQLGPEHRYAVRIDVVTETGRTLEGAMADRPGGPTQPMSAPDIIDKFNALAEPHLGDTGAKALRDLVERLEAVEDCGELVARMSRSAT